MNTVVVFLIWPTSHIWVVSAIFGVLSAAAFAAKYFYPQLRCWPLFMIVAMWLAFGVYQTYADLWRGNIRIDLVLIVPVLLGGTVVLTVLQLWSLLRALRSTKAGK